MVSTRSSMKTRSTARRVLTRDVRLSGERLLVLQTRPAGLSPSCHHTLYMAF